MQSSIFHSLKQTLALPRSMALSRTFQTFTSKKDNILKEVNQENRELYTKEQKQKLLSQEQAEKELLERFFKEKPSNYFSKSNPWKTRQGRSDKDLDDLSGDEADEIRTINTKELRQKTFSEK